MRIGGLASGMNTDEIIAKLMKAERAPLDKMQQDKQRVTWQRDGLRDINNAISSLKYLAIDMTKNFKTIPTTIKSSMESAVTATGGDNNASYDISVKSLATKAVNGSTQGIGYKGKSPIDPVPADWHGTVKFAVYKDGKQDVRQFNIEEGDTLESVLIKLNIAGEGKVAAFYDDVSDKFIMETKTIGDNNPNGAEIDFSVDTSNFFKDKLFMGTEQGGTDAVFEYNGIELKSKTNSYQVNNLSLQFHDVTPAGTSAKLVVQHDTDKAFNNVVEFIDKYNAVVEKLNKTQQERKYRDFPPLTEEQKKDMSEDQIKKWEEKAKSGLLRGDSIISNLLNGMRTSMYKNVETSGQFSNITEIGLSTSKNYMDGGKIILKDSDGKELREALAKDPEAVLKLFKGEGDAVGLSKLLEDQIKTAENSIAERAGKPANSSLSEDTLGKRMTALDKRISDFERRLTQVETRYWNQFNAMEKAVSRLNSQSTQLLSQFGGGM